MEFIFTEDAEMDLIDTTKMRTDLKRLLRRFESCFPDKNTRNDLRIYTTGLVSGLPRKNAEAIALQAIVPVRSVQWFLAKQTWNHERMRTKIHRCKWTLIFAMSLLVLSELFPFVSSLWWKESTGVVMIQIRQLAT